MVKGNFGHFPGSSQFVDPEVLEWMGGQFTLKKDPIKTPKIFQLAFLQLFGRDTYSLFQG